MHRIQENQFQTWKEHSTGLLVDYDTKQILKKGYLDKSRNCEYQIGREDNIVVKIIY